MLEFERETLARIFVGKKLAQEKVIRGMKSKSHTLGRRALSAFKGRVIVCSLSLVFSVPNQRDGVPTDGSSISLNTTTFLSAED